MLELLNPQVDPATLSEVEQSIVRCLDTPKTAGSLHRELGIHLVILQDAIKRLTQKQLIKFIAPEIPV